MEKKEQLLAEILPLFLKYGIRSLNMDDIARHLGISKKTLYLYFNDKNDIIESGFKLRMEVDKFCVHSIQEQKDNAIEELLEITETLSANMQSMHPSIWFDLNKYHPNAFKMFEQYKNTFIYESVLKNLKKGLEQGLYRKEIKPELIAKFYVSKIELMFDAEFFMNLNLNPVEVHRENIIYHLHGIVNKKGREILEKFISENN